MRPHTQRIPRLNYLSDNASSRGQPSSPALGQVEPQRSKNSPPSKTPSKTSGGFLSSIIGVREPSRDALKQFANQQAKMGSVRNTSSRKLPSHVPKVNTRWDGMPSTSSACSSHGSRSTNSRDGSTPSNTSRHSSTLATSLSSYEDSTAMGSQTTQRRREKPSGGRTRPRTSGAKQSRPCAEPQLHEKTNPKSSGPILPELPPLVATSTRARRQETLGDGATLPGLDASAVLMSSRSPAGSEAISWFDSDDSSDNDDTFNLTPDRLVPESPLLQPASLVDKAIIGDSIGLVSAWPTPASSKSRTKAIVPVEKGISARQSSRTHEDSAKASPRPSDEENLTALLSSSSSTSSGAQSEPLDPGLLNVPCSRPTANDSNAERGDPSDVMPSPTVSRSPLNRILRLASFEVASKPPSMPEVESEEAHFKPRPVQRPVATERVSYAMPKSLIKPAPAPSPSPPTVRNFARPFSSESSSPSSPPEPIITARSQGQTSVPYTSRKVAIASTTLAPILESETGSVNSLRL